MAGGAAAKGRAGNQPQGGCGLPHPLHLRRRHLGSGAPRFGPWPLSSCIFLSHAGCSQLSSNSNWVKWLALATGSIGRCESLALFTGPTCHCFGKVHVSMCCSAAIPCGHTSGRTRVEKFHTNFNTRRVVLDIPLGTRTLVDPSGYQACPEFIESCMECGNDYLGLDSLWHWSTL